MDTFQALADPNRRHIIELLAKNGQLSSTDISDKFKISAPAISQHLKVLREARLVKMEKRAQKHLYQINPAKIEELEAWLERLKKHWDAKFDRLDKVLEAEKNKILNLVQDDKLGSDSVRVVVFDQKDSSHFLVLSEADDPTNLKLPGGKFKDLIELPNQAAKRELKEELGLTIKLVKAGELINDDGVSRRHIYFGQASKGEIKPSSEIDHLKWLTVKSIPEGKNRRHILSAVKLSKGV